MISVSPEITTRRGERFFGSGGICERYERCGDDLIEFDDIAAMVADALPAVTRDAVRRRFVMAVKLGRFGRRGPRQAADQLIDLTNYTTFRPGQYPLRPSVLTVEGNPDQMRATRSIWARWIESERWPVPPIMSTAETATTSANTATADAVTTHSMMESTPKRGRGNPGGTSKRIIAEMQKMNPDELRAMKQEAMAEKFDASRSTCEKAREAVLSNIVE